ncbi:AsmA-like C-terminal domain-containing protein [Thermovirga sp.]|uniref:AsmA-like C-terminal domain-containing protein n=1 Tax=Thermovirga sp. TaxID=2699834 RepID=UPI0026002A3E|nr:AsmA-like C-terminal domain-containing protein [Thermovirga sp.]MBO8154239.1 AsmA-like C-terminal domain-containing protein [Thermovirga sp.]
MKKYVKTLFVALSIAFIGFGGGVLFLSQKNVAVDYAKASAQRLAKEHLGADLTLKQISGNPIRGYTVLGISLDRGGGTLARAQSLVVRLAPLPLLFGEAKIRSISVNGGDFFADDLLSLLRKQTPAVSETLPEGSISFTKSTVHIKDSSFFLDSLKVASREHAFTFRGKVAYRGVVAQLDGEASYQKGVFSFEKFKTTIGSSSIEVFGAIFPKVTCKGRLSDVDLSVLSALWPDLKDKGFSGKFSATFEAEGPWQEIGIRGSLSMDKGKIWGIPIEGLRSDWWSRGKKLWFENISGLANSSKVSGKIGMLFSTLPPELYFDLNVLDADLGLWQKNFSWLSFVKGDIKKAHLGFSIKRGKILGPVKLEAASVTIAQQPIEKLTAHLEFKGNDTSLVSLSGKWLNSPVAGSGIIRTGKRPSFDFTLSGKAIALNKAWKIIPIGGMKLEGLAGGTVRIKGTPGKVSSEGKLWSNKIRVMGQLIEKPSVEFTYNNSVLSIKSLSAKWAGLPIKGSGEALDLGTGKPSLNFRGTAKKVSLAHIFKTLNVATLAGLEGEVSTSWKLTGNVNNPTLTLSFSSDAIKGPYNITLSDTTLWGSIPLSSISKAPSKIDISFKAQRGSLDKVKTGEITGKATYSPGEIKFEDVSLKLWDSQIGATGRVVMPKEPKGKPQLEFEGTAQKINLAEMGNVFDIPLSGTLNAAFRITGAISSPEVTADFSCDDLVIRSYSFGEAEGSISISDGVAKILQSSAQIGEGTISVKGSFPIVKGKEKDISLSINGENLDLSLFTKELRKARSMNLKGLVNVSMEASRSGGEWTGEGEMSSNEINIFNLAVRDFYAPLSFSGKFLKAYKAKGTFYGGSLTADGLFNLMTGKWSAMIATSNTDIEGVVRDSLKLKGKITGKGDLNLNLEGSFTKPMPIKGNGRLSAKNGEIAGFKAVKAVAAAHGMSSIRYNTVNTHFNILGNTITLMPGSRMTAYPQDPLYRYITADGSIGPGSSIDLNCSGNINIQTLNALVGAIQGIMGSDIQNPQEFLSGLLGGLVGGLSKQDFRDVTFHVSGSWEKPVISGIKVYEPVKSQPIPEDNTDPSVEDDQTKVNINLPTNGSDESVGDQLKQQILEQIFKQSVPND